MDMWIVFRNSRVISAVVGLIVAALVAAFPQIEGYEAQITDNLLWVALAVLAGSGGFSLSQIALGWLARPGSVSLVVSGAQEGVDFLESWFHIDIPDPLEDAAYEELRRRLQAEADRYIREQAGG